MHTANIISNNLDQVSKTAENGYEARLKEPILAKEIKNVLDAPYLHGEDEVIDWIWKHQRSLPIHKITRLAPWEKIAFEIKRESKTPERWVWEEATGTPLPIDEVISRIGSIQSFKKEAMNPGDTSTYLVFDREFPKKNMEQNKDFQLKLVQVELPSTNALVMKNMAYYKEVNKNETKALLDTINL